MIYYKIIYIIYIYYKNRQKSLNSKVIVNFKQIKKKQNDDLNLSPANFTEHYISSTYIFHIYSLYLAKFKRPRSKSNL